MKKLMVISAILVGLFTSDAVRAQETNISVDASIDALSGYTWRGGVLGADDKAVLQPSLTVGFGESGVSVNVWGSFFAQNRTALESFDELDFTADYSGTLSEENGIGFSVGYIQYTFPNGGPGAEHSEEVYGSLSFDHAMAPSVTVYYDFGLIKDFYATAGIGPEFPLGDGDNAPVLGIGASIGISGKKYGGSSGFNDVTLSASIGWASGNISFTPSVGYSYADDGVNADNSSFWIGVSFGISK